MVGHADTWTAPSMLVAVVSLLVTSASYYTQTHPPPPAPIRVEVTIPSGWRRPDSVDNDRSVGISAAERSSTDEFAARRGYPMRALLDAEEGELVMLQADFTYLVVVVGNCHRSLEWSSDRGEAVGTQDGGLRVAKAGAFAFHFAEGSAPAGSCNARLAIYRKDQA